MSVPRKPFPLSKIPVASSPATGLGEAAAIKSWPIPECDRDMLEMEYRRAVAQAFRPKRPEPEPLDEHDWVWS
jgi:hypothetical protein